MYVYIYLTRVRSLGQFSPPPPVIFSPHKKIFYSKSAQPWERIGMRKENLLKQQPRFTKMYNPYNHPNLQVTISSVCDAQTTSSTPAIFAVWAHG